MIKKKKHEHRLVRFVIFIGLFWVVLTLLRPYGEKWVRFGYQKLYPLRYTREVEVYAAEFDLDPLLVTAFIRVESGFDPEAVSKVGARGLMQLTEETYSWVRSKLEPDSVWDYDSMFEPEKNIRYGCYYLCYCLARYDGEIATAAAAYISGCGTVDRLLEETQYSSNGVTLTVFPFKNMQNYVRKITHCYQGYLTAYSGSDTLK